MRIVKATIVLCVPAQVLHVERCRVARDEALQLKEHIRDAIGKSMYKYLFAVRTNLWRREQRQPVGIHDAAEATNEGGRLLAYLRVHPEVGTVVDVVDPGGGKENVVTNQINNSNNIILLVIVGDWSRAATRMQFVRDNLAHLIFVDRKSEIQVGHFSLFGNMSRLLFSINSNLPHSPDSV